MLSLSLSLTHFLPIGTCLLTLTHLAITPIPTYVPTAHLSHFLLIGTCSLTLSLLFVLVPYLHRLSGTQKQSRYAILCIGSDHTI